MFLKLQTWLKQPSNQQKLLVYLLLLFSLIGLWTIGRSLLGLSAVSCRTDSAVDGIKVKRPQAPLTDPDSPNEAQSNQSSVLGRKTGSISLYGDPDYDHMYTHSALLSQTIHTPPIFVLEAYGDFSGEVNIKVFKVDQNFLFDFFLHDEKNDLINQEFNLDSQRLKAEFNEQLDLEESKKIELPVESSGLWYISMEGVDAQDEVVTDDLFVSRSDLGATIHEGQDKNIIWVQDLTSKRSVPNAQVKIINLENQYQQLSEHTTNDVGVAEVPLTAQADLALVSKEGDLAVLPINLQLVNYSYAWDYFSSQDISQKGFIFTDKPLYKPGDTVYYKAILRNDNDADYSIPSGSVQVSASEYFSLDEEEPFFSENLSISQHGTVYGQVKLPEKESSSRVYLFFQFEDKNHRHMVNVQEYRKPEYFLNLDSPKLEYIAGDSLFFEVEGQYFSGEPLMNQSLEFEVFSNDYYDFTYYYQSDEEPRLYYWGHRYDRNELVSKTQELDQAGYARMYVSTDFSNDGKDKVLTAQASFLDETANRVQAVDNILIRAGEFGIYRQKDTYQMTRVGETASLDLELIAHQGGSISRRPVTASLTRTYWERIDEEGRKWPRYERREEQVNDLQAQSNQQGKLTLEFTPKESGSYRWEVEAEDERGNIIKKTFNSYIYKQDQPIFSGETLNQLVTVTPDKDEYLPEDTLQLSIFSEQPDIDLLITLERGYVHRYQVVSMQGNNETIDIPLEDWDMPNIFVSAGTFTDTDHTQTKENILVRPDKKELKVTLNTDKVYYGPSDKVELQVTTTDHENQPVSADLAVWAVDKAMFELADDKTGDIFDHYWDRRSNRTSFNYSLRGIMGPTGAEMGGCFAGDTQVLMADGNKLPISQVKVGDRVQTITGKNEQQIVSTPVIAVHQAEVSGYLIINGSLKITPNHKLFVNGAFRRADNIGVGDKLLNYHGDEVIVDSIEWSSGVFNVYNLTTANYNTYFAGGIYVHNKGGVRDTFVDTAYWNPAVRTDAAGQASLEFTLPDNLTTWVLAGLGTTLDTQAGQNTHEIIVGKKIRVRPVLPNVLRLGDKAYLSAIVHNFSDKEREFMVSLETDAASVKNQEQTISLESGGRKLVSWLVEPQETHAGAEFRFSAAAVDDRELKDVIVKTLPINLVGFREMKGEFKIGSTEFGLGLDPEANLDESSVTLTLTPSILGTVDSGLRFFLSYPYGCSEQVSSRMAMILAAESNADLFKAALKNRDIDEMIETGVERLKKLQNTDGGWGWWRGESSPFMSVQVAAVLSELQSQRPDQDLGSMVSDAGNFFESLDPNASLANKIYQYYGLSLLGGQEAIDQSFSAEEIEQMDVDLLAYTIIADQRRDYTDPVKTQRILDLAEEQAGGLVWKAGPKERFGSDQASTALAVQALLNSESNQETAAKAVHYLLRSRNHIWANTFGTAQVMRALKLYSELSGEQSPNYSYQVILGDETIKSGQIVDYRDLIEIELPLQKIKSASNRLRVEQNGQGQLYSTLTIDQFVESTRTAAEGQGLEIKREYISERGEKSNLAVGDEVLVRLTISGLAARESYGFIHDYLPAGMIPINKALESEKDIGDSSRSYYYDWHQEATLDGMIISMRRMQPGKKVYEYSARVVSPGTYYAPPAAVSLMYAPEVYARTGVEKVNLEQEAAESAVSDIEEDELLDLIIGLMVLIMIITFVIFLGLGLLVLVGLIFSKMKSKKTGGHKQDQPPLPPRKMQPPPLPPRPSPPPAPRPPTQAEAAQAKTQKAEEQKQHTLEFSEDQDSQQPAGEKVSQVSEDDQSAEERPS